MTEISLDGALELEEEYYKLGFSEGHEQAVRDQILDGKAYGLQTGFQRFLAVGYLQGMVEIWEKTANASVQLHVGQLKQLLGSIPTANNDADVEAYEQALGKARNKARVIAVLTKSHGRIAGLDKLVKEVGGSMLVQESLDETW